MSAPRLLPRSHGSDRCRAPVGRFDRARRGPSGLSALLLAVATATLASPVLAQEPAPILLGVEGSLAIPVAPPQSDRFYPGGSLVVAVQVPLASSIIATGRARGMFLGDAPAPADPSLRDPGVGWMGSLTLGLRLRPLGWVEPQSIQRASGAWIELDAGAALSGAWIRPTFEAGIGWAFELDDVRVGPVVRFAQVLHFDDPLDSAPASMVTLGAEVVLFDRRAQPVEVVAPPSDRDGDGIVDDVDGCPDEPEDRDGFEDQDGCPELDNDRDGILDVDDGCRLEPEDIDTWQDLDGCPDPDNDGDGFLDPADACPNEAEVVNGVDDTDGCPDEGLIQMIEDRIVIDERVLFDFGLAHVKHTARPTLQAIVDLWRQHPDWSHVRIEGHADARGNPELNHHLSELRAEHVRDMLVDLGMPTEMIEVVGYGATRLRDTRGTEEAHQRNRRVEFVVTARHPAGEIPAPSAPLPETTGATP